MLSNSITTTALDVRDADGGTGPLTGIFVLVWKNNALINNQVTAINLEYGGGEAPGMGVFFAGSDNSGGSGPSWELWLVLPGFGDGNIDGGINVAMTNLLGNTIVTAFGVTMTSVNTGLSYNVADYNFGDAGGGSSPMNFSRTFASLTGSKLTIGVDPASTEWIVGVAVDQGLTPITMTINTGVEMMTQVDVGASTPTAMSVVLGKLDPATGGSDTVGWTKTGTKSGVYFGFFPMPICNQFGDGNSDSSKLI